MAAAAEPPCPPLVRGARPYAVHARMLARADPLMSHYCRLWVVEICLREGGGQLQSDPAAMAFVNHQLGELERGKAALAARLRSLKEAVVAAPTPEEEALGAVPQTGEALYVQNFALKIFLAADNEDRAGRATRLTAKNFNAAQQFLEVARQFFPSGQLPPDVAVKQRYAKRRATLIAGAIARGDPPPPPPDADGGGDGGAGAPPPPGNDGFGGSSGAGGGGGGSLTAADFGAPAPTSTPDAGADPLAFPSVPTGGGEGTGGGGGGGGGSLDFPTVPPDTSSAGLGFPAVPTVGDDAFAPTSTSTSTATDIDALFPPLAGGNAADDLGPPPSTDEFASALNNAEGEAGPPSFPAFPPSGGGNPDADPSMPTSTTTAPEPASDVNVAPQAGDPVMPAYPSFPAPPGALSQAPAPAPEEQQQPPPAAQPPAPAQQPPAAAQPPAQQPLAPAAPMEPAAPPPVVPPASSAVSPLATVAGSLRSALTGGGSGAGAGGGPALAVGTPGYVPNPDQMELAAKHARFVGSSVQFDDAAAAILNAHKVLHYLIGSPMPPEAPKR